MNDRNIKWDKICDRNEWNSKWDDVPLIGNEK